MVATSPFAKIASVIPDPVRSPIVKLHVGTPSKKPPSLICGASMLVTLALKPTDYAYFVTNLIQESPWVK